MSAASSVHPPATARSSAAARRARPRAASVGQRAIPALFAISCCICDKLGPIRSTRELGAHPGARSGFEYRVVGGIGGHWCRTCRRIHDAAKPPATRGDCIDGPRPCPHVFCRYSLAFDVSRKASKDFELPESCALDVADAHPDGMTLSAVGALLGMTREGTRYQEVPALAKLRQIQGLEHAFEHADHEQGDEG